MARPRPIRRLLHRFLREESGSVTLWNMLWFTGFCAFYGLAMDSSSAMLMLARLQSTADSAAIAGAYALRPTEVTVDTDAALAAARLYGDANMDPAVEGNFLRDEDITFGTYDFATRTFDAEGTPATAIRVVTRRDETAGNPLLTGFLRVVNWFSWDVSAVSIAAVRYEQCALDGLISASQVVMDSSNIYGAGYCVYGRTGIRLVNNNNYFVNDKQAFAGYSRAVTHECGFFLGGVQGDPPICNMDTNPGLESGRFVSDAIHPARLYQLDANGQPVRDADGNPIVTLGATINALIDEAEATGTTWVETAWRPRRSNTPVAAVNTALQAGGAHIVLCNQDRDVLALQGGDYHDLLLITNCLLELPGGSPSNPNIYSNVRFVSTSTSSHSASAPFRDLDHNIVVRGGNQLGTDCANFGVEFFTMSGVKFDGGNIHMGVEVNAGGSVGIDGDNDGASTDRHSLSVHALGDITMTSNSTYSLCRAAAAPGPSADARPVFSLVQ